MPVTFTADSSKYSNSKVSEIKKTQNQPIADLQTRPSEIFIEVLLSGTVRGHMSTDSMKNQPSISVQLTATSAMGILKHWAIYRSSTSKALREER